MRYRSALSNCWQLILREKQKIEKKTKETKTHGIQSSSQFSTVGSTRIAGYCVSITKISDHILKKTFKNYYLRGYSSSQATIGRKRLFAAFLKSENSHQAPIHSERQLAARLNANWGLNNDAN